MVLRLRHTHRACRVNRQGASRRGTNRRGDTLCAIPLRTLMCLGWLAHSLIPNVGHAREATPTDIAQEQSAATDGGHRFCFLERPFAVVAKLAVDDPDARADLSLPGLEADSFRAADGSLIRGLVWRAQNPRGYVLVTLGTSMTAEEVYPYFANLPDLGLDVFIYNYRGFKHSEGETTLPGILSDTRMVIDHLNRDPRYRYRFFYGLSFGGIVLTNTLRADDYDAVVLDSVPDTVPFLLFCPERLDPRQHLPASCAHWRAVAGHRDRVIGGAGVRLAEAVEACGGTTLVEEHFGHIFADGDDPSIQRLTSLQDYLDAYMMNNPPGKREGQGDQGQHTGAPETAG